MLKEIELDFESIYQNQPASRTDTATLGEAAVECFDPPPPCVECFEPSATPTAAEGQKSQS